MVTMGFGIVEQNVSNFSLKLVMSLTATKFFITEISATLQNIQFLIPTIVTVEIMYMFCLVLVIVIYMVTTVKTITIAIALTADNDRLEPLHNALKYRLNLLIFCYALTILQYIGEICVSVFWAFLVTQSNVDVLENALT